MDEDLIDRRNETLLQMPDGELLSLGAMHGYARLVDSITDLLAELAMELATDEDVEVDA